jgi:hypothetical protein
MAYRPRLPRLAISATTGKRLLRIGQPKSQRNRSNDDPVRRGSESDFPD